MRGAVQRAAATLCSGPTLYPPGTWRGTEVLYISAPMITPFVKMHGCGNDFVILDERFQPLGLTPARAAAIANRHTGIGCDQVIAIQPDRTADAFMDITNPDGSRAGACGNATRCVADILMREIRRDTVTIRTISGDLPAIRRPDGLIEVDMGAARLEWSEIPLSRPMDTIRLDLPGGPAAVSMGNPHATFFVSELETAPILEAGPRFDAIRCFRNAPDIGSPRRRPRHYPPPRLGARTGSPWPGSRRAPAGECPPPRPARRAPSHCNGDALDIEWRTRSYVLMAGPDAAVFHGVGQIDLWPYSSPSAAA